MYLIVIVFTGTLLAISPSTSFYGIDLMSRKNNDSKFSGNLYGSLGKFEIHTSWQIEELACKFNKEPEDDTFQDTI